eukprot:scaffold251912_cov40-Tisochrysis_lutea.AAC.1
MAALPIPYPPGSSRTAPSAPFNDVFGGLPQCLGKGLAIFVASLVEIPDSARCDLHVATGDVSHEVEKHGIDPTSIVVGCAGVSAHL